MSVLQFSIVVVCSALWAAEAVIVCPVQSSQTHQVRVHGDFCYQFHLTETRGYGTAQADCRSQGGNEIVIRDADTQCFLVEVLQRDFHYSGLVWIGLNDVSKEGVFTWVDGSPLTFSSWAQGQPGGVLAGIEDCVVMDMGDGGHWHDYRCEDFLFFHNPHPFICQFAMKHTGSTVTLPSPATTATTTEPSTMVPASTMEPTTGEPSTTKPSTIEPSTTKPSTIEPSTTKPTTKEPSTVPTTQQK